MLSLGVAACGSDDKDSSTSSSSTSANLNGTIAIDGSSTVGPLSEAAAEQFQGDNSGVRVTVGTSGTGGGFEKFCAGETDISDASRQIEPDEVSACKKKGISYTEIQIANDGIAVVANPQNDWAKCLTTAQLKKIWDKGSKVNNWNQVDSSFPDQKLSLSGPGTDSGTFDFFTKVINGEEGQSRTDYSASENDNDIVQFVSGDKGASGYFGLSYAEQNPDKIKILEVDGGKGCVAPSKETVQDGSYTPLSRPLYIYVSNDAFKRPEVAAFVKAYVDNEQQIAEQALFVDLTDEQEKAAQDAVAKATS